MTLTCELQFQYGVGAGLGEKLQTLVTARHTAEHQRYEDYVQVSQLFFACQVEMSEGIPLTRTKGDVS